MRWSWWGMWLSAVGGMACTGVGGGGGDPYGAGEGQSSGLTPAITGGRWSGGADGGGGPVVFSAESVTLSGAWLEGEVSPGYVMDRQPAQAMVVDLPERPESLVVRATLRGARVQAVLLVQGGVLGPHMGPPRRGPHPLADMLGCAVQRADGTFEVDLRTQGPPEVEVTEEDPRTRKITFRGHVGGNPDPLVATVEVTAAAR